MPSVEQALTARLEGSTAVTSVVGSRIYPTQMPQDPAFPLITYDLISSQREWGHKGDSGDVHARMQVTGWSDVSYTEALSVSEGVRTATQRWAGTSTGVVVQEMFIENEFTFYDDTTGTYAHSLDLIVHYEE